MLQAEQVLQDRYQLKRQLGQNTGRQTWLAEDLEQKESVVLKLLTFGGDVQWEDLKLFEREAQVLQQLNHPRIPKYRDYFSLDDKALWFGLVQEYIPGLSLKGMLERGRKFSEAEVLKIATEVLHILIYLHELNPPVLHRDIKPSNLIWRPSPPSFPSQGETGEIYLVDFGAVQDKAAAEGRTFTVVGTYGYAPMEQFGGRAVPASDLYALGATLIHLLTGLSPADLPQDEMRIEFGDRTSAPPRLVHWIEKLTEPSVKKRYGSARQALTAFESGAIFDSSKHPQASANTGASSSRREIARISQPLGTSIQFHKSSASLRIEIPGKGLRSYFHKSSQSFPKQRTKIGNRIASSTLNTIFGAIALGVFGLSILMFLLPIFPMLFFFGAFGLWVILQGYGCTYVDFDRDRFAIAKQMFGYTYKHQHGRTADVEYVLAYATGLGKDGKPIGMAIAIQAAMKRYTIDGFAGSQMTEVEAAWLAQEIQDWLRME